MMKYLLGLVAGAGLILAGSLTQMQAQQNCDPAYPDFCLAPPPPDLDCGDISYENFRVLQPDPHRFDGDQDGIGCEPRS